MNAFRKIFLAGTALILTGISLSVSGIPGIHEKIGAGNSGAGSEGLSTGIVRFTAPADNSASRLKQPVKIILALGNPSVIPDSVTVYFNGKYVSTIKSAPWQYSIPASYNITTGKKSVKVNAYKKGKNEGSAAVFIVTYSDIVPAKNGYKLINTYPHSRDAFTQGLVYDKGVLYEGTGQESGSSIREEELETGKVLRQHNLDNSLFGEGIALVDDRLYEVTWKNKVGFIYNKSDFRLINRIYYETEGWGLTTVNDRIVMSDGSNVLYFYEPDMFTVVSKIEVYDNVKKVDKLNELEYINGEIWANIWMTDEIARIDPASGKVIAYINLKGILPDSDRDADTDVLNGIAFDSAGKRIFVTGKKWPKLFEIKITQ